MIKRSEAIVSFLGLYCKAQPHASFVSNYTVHTAHPLDHSEAVPLFIVRKSLTQHAMPRAQCQMPYLTTLVIRVCILAL